jgi:hypothetical protein
MSTTYTNRKKKAKSDRSPANGDKIPPASGAVPALLAISISRFIARLISRLSLAAYRTKNVYKNVVKTLGTNTFGSFFIRSRDALRTCTRCILQKI